MIAVLNRDKALFKFLMRHNADVTQKFEGLNLLHVACLRGFTAIKEYPIFNSGYFDHGYLDELPVIMLKFLVDDLDNHGKTPLYCIRNGYSFLYDFMIKNGMHHFGRLLNRLIRINFLEISRHYLFNNISRNFLKLSRQKTLLDYVIQLKT